MPIESRQYRQSPAATREGVVLDGDGGVCDRRRDTWVQLGSQSRVVSCNQGIGVTEGAVYVDDNSWVGVALEAQFDNNPVSIVGGVDGGYGGNPLGGRGDVPICCLFGVGEDLTRVCLRQSGEGGVLG